MPKSKKVITKRKSDALTEFVLNRFEYSKMNMMGRHSAWREYYDDYRGTRLGNKEPWQANYIIPCLKESVRTITPIYLNILLSAGLKSFDIKPGERTDKRMADLLKDVLVYQLDGVARRRGGFFATMEGFIKQFEIYGYSAVEVPWRTETYKGKMVFDGPDIEVIDIFNFFPDPGALNVGDSWVVLRKRDVFLSYLRMLEKQEIYSHVSDLRDTEQPLEEYDTLVYGQSGMKDDRVELLEYHGEVPKDLIEGSLDDESLVDIYEDEFVQALITIANRKVCIRADVYPFECGSIFVDASRDRMPNEHFGIGQGEDIQPMAAELTNAHNKLFDCVNLIANPMGVANPSKISGLGGGVMISHPGKIFITNPNIQNVADAMVFFNMTAQAGALSPLAALIQSLDERIQKVTQAVPVIAAMPNKKGLPETLGATLMMQGNAAEPIKHTVRHCLEPWFQRVLEIFYKLDLQFFPNSSAYRVLGDEKGREWEDERRRAYISKEDLRLVGNPDFIPRGVSIFNEKQQDIDNLLNYWKVAQGAMVPAIGPDGNPIVGPDGQPVMVPLVDQAAIAIRLAEKFELEDPEEIIPSLREMRRQREAAQVPQAGVPQGVLPQPATSPPQGQPTSPLSPGDILSKLTGGRT